MCAADIFPVLTAAIECPTHSIIDAALRSLPVVLPILDFSTIKNELFPIIAVVFTRTNSLAIKVRGLQSFVILCGGSADAAADDGLNGLTAQSKKTSSSSALDKYTMQEKIVPLVKGIKTKEPAVMMAALNVLRIVGQAADAEFVAMDILPILWSMSLGPLLELKQFQTFMELIRLLSKKVEDDQTRKLQELSGSAAAGAKNEDFLSFGGVTGTSFDQSNGATEDDFETLVKGRTSTSAASANNGFSSWDDAPNANPTASTARSSTSTPAPAFSWSTSAAAAASPPGQASAVKSQHASFRTVTPDLGRFESLTPSSTQFSQPMQPTQASSSSTSGFPAPSPPQPQSPPAVNWSAAAAGSAAASNPWASTPAPNYSSSAQPTGMGAMGSSMASMSLGQTQGQAPSLMGGAAQSRTSSSFSLAPPPGRGTPSGPSLGVQSPPAQLQQNPWAGMGQSTPSTGLSGAAAGGIQQQQQQQPKQGSGLDKYQSLI